MSKPRRSWVRAGRALWGGLAFVALVLLGLTSLLSARAEESAEIDARQRAERAAAAVLLGELSPRLASGDIVGAERRDLLEAVRSRILNDDRVARVRIWSTDGELIFSSATRDDASTVIAEDHLQFSQAAGGVPASITVDATETAGPLHQTFVPLRIPDGVAPYAVAEIDQRYDAIRAEANRIWRPVQIGLVVALGAVAVLFALSFASRRAAGPAGERVPSREVEEGAPAADEGVRAAEPATFSAEPATFLAEPATFSAEPLALPAEPVVPPAQPVTLPAEPFALPAGPVAVTPEEPSADAERPQPEVSSPQIPPDVRARIDELEMQLRAEVAEREHFAAEVQRLRSGIDEREVELAGAKQGAAASEAERSRSAGQVAEATRRAAEAEKRAKEAEKQAAAADKRAEKVERAKRDHGSKVAEDLRAAQLETNALKQKLAEVEASLADANARLAERKRAAPEGGRTPAAAPETASAGLEVELLRAERDVATADLARTRRELETTRAELDDARATVAEMEAPPRDEIT
jgi:hypothetical protein